MKPHKPTNNKGGRFGAVTGPGPKSVQRILERIARAK
jgi:hypothetical protein